MKKVIIYSTPSCGWCHRAKEFFSENNVKFSEKDVSADAAAREEMLNKSQQMAVPVIDIEGEITIGFDRPRLVHLLGL